MDSRNVPLRILYTINSSPQYILARSSSSVPVVSLQSSPSYATTFLKTCLDTICRSSPELVQDVARDFSVYVLDPLESNSAPAPVNISNTASNRHSTPSASPELSNGVAVGLGLMSWALVAGESDGVTVIGTLVKQGTGQEALEVIFALREVRVLCRFEYSRNSPHCLLQTAPMQKDNLAAALKSWGTQPISTLKPFDIPTFQSLRQSNLSSQQPTSTVTSILPPGFIPPSNSQPCQATAPFSNSNTRLPKPSAPSTSANVSASLSSRLHSRKKPPKVRKCIKATPSLSSEADKIMLAEETYIGPRRKKGRPAKGSGPTEGGEGRNAIPALAHADEGVIVIDDTGAREQGTAPALTGHHLTDSNKSEHSKDSSIEHSVSPAAALPRPEPDPSDPVMIQSSVTVLDILACLSASASSPDPNAQNAALLAALNSIDSTAGPDKTSNPVLVNALKGLISAVSKPTSPPRTRDSQAFRSHINDHRRSVSQDDEIELLDKENINPTAFRRRADRSESEKKVLGAESPASAGGLSASSLGSRQVSAHSSATHFDGTSHNRNLNVHSVLATAPTSPNPVGRRKRTLSDFMDDRDARMNSRRTRGKEGAERTTYRHAQSVTRRTSMRSSTSGLRHYPRLLLCDQLQQRDTTGTSSYYRTGTECWSSPPRSRSEDHSTMNSRRENNAENSQLSTIDIPDPWVTASSPVRSQSRHRKPYVVPAWARTETATQPRLSQAALQAQGEVGGNDQWKKKNRRGEKKRRVRSATLSSSASQTDTAARPEDSTTSTTLPQPIASSSDCPVFAVTSTLFQSMSPGPFPSNSNVNVPRTPPRRRITHTPGDGSGSLFTPASPRAVNDTLARSPFISPEGLFTPLPSKTTNTFTCGAGDVNYQSITPTDAAMEEVDGDKDTEDVLHQELDDAFKEIEPSCSLLSDSSGEIAWNEVSSTTGTPWVGIESAVHETGEDVTVNALWAGLPPSSPPPMSSPLLTPEVCSDDEDMDDLDLPVATSDVEDYGTDSEPIPPSRSSAMPDLSTCSDQEFADYLTNNNLSALLAAVDRSPAMDHEAEFDMDIFNQFTTLNAQSDGSFGNQDSDMEVDAGGMQFQNGLAEFDFTEFWETFKPLVQEHMPSTGNTDTRPEFILDRDPHTPDMMENFNHTKLAEDVQALLSGCLV